MFRQLGMGYESAKALTNVAIAASHHGDTRFALELFGKARELFTRSSTTRPGSPPSTSTRRWCSTRSAACSRPGPSAESAFEFFSQSPLVGRAVLSQLILARIHLDSGRPEVARAICLAALQSLDQTETPALSYQAFFVLGLIEEALGWPEQAYEAYRKGARAIWKTCAAICGPTKSKIAFLMDKQEVYESLVRMSLDRRTSGASLEPAFQYIEQAKSRSLADLIAFRAHSLPAPTATHAYAGGTGPRSARAAELVYPRASSCRKAASATCAIRAWRSCAGRPAIASRS